jgi:hypothetical protein
LKDLDAKTIDAMLATACSRTLNAAFKMNRMRDLLRAGMVEHYWREMIALHEDLVVGGNAILEANRIQLSREGIMSQAEQGGLVH